MTDSPPRLRLLGLLIACTGVRSMTSCRTHHPKKTDTERREIARVVLLTGSASSHLVRTVGVSSATDRLPSLAVSLVRWRE